MIETSILINEVARLFENPSHTGWYLHDAYWAGACVFLIHFLWLRLSILHQKNVLFSLTVMTAFWPLTYTISIIHIIRMRLVNSKSSK